MKRKKEETNHPASSRDAVSASETKRRIEQLATGSCCGFTAEGPCEGRKEEMKNGAVSNNETPDDKIKNDFYSLLSEFKNKLNDIKMTEKEDKTVLIKMREMIPYDSSESIADPVVDPIDKLLLEKKLKPKNRIKNVSLNATPETKTTLTYACIMFGFLALTSILPLMVIWNFYGVAGMSMTSFPNLIWNEVIPTSIYNPYTCLTNETLPSSGATSLTLQENFLSLAESLNTEVMNLKTAYPGYRIYSLSNAVVKDEENDRFELYIKLGFSKK